MPTILWNLRFVDTVAWIVQGEQREFISTLDKRIYLHPWNPGLL